MKVNKNIVALLGLTVIIGGLMVGCGVSEEDQAMIDNYPKLEEQVKELQAKVDEAQPWFTMKESEKVAMEKEAKIKKQEEELRKAEGIFVYEDENIKINFKEVKKNGIYFNVENKTDVVITVQADSVSVNGISSNNIMMSDDISPKSKGVIHAQTSIDSSVDLENILTISGQLRIIDFNDSFKSYDVSFVNLDVAQ